MGKGLPPESQYAELCRGKRDSEEETADGGRTDVSDQRIGKGAQEKGKRASGRERGSVLTESAVNVANGQVYYTTESTTVVKGSGGSGGVGGGTWSMMYV